MFLAEPPRTQFDLNFQVLGFPVRVHPLFWLIGALIGYAFIRDYGAIGLVIWVFAMFVSILLHELGHALMIRRFGRDAHIVLYAMGGLAIEGRPQSNYGNPWSLDSYTGYQPRQRTPQEQILISAAGPGIQLVLAGLVIAAVYASGGYMRVGGGLLPLPQAILGRDLAANVNIQLLVHDLLFINIFWAIMNLLPVLPLDGGQIALQVFMQHDPWQGTIRALWLSVIT
ncbi:MAG TPA: site-2 protease family protein, partial [Pirellulaceae bacterium]|nr:site-2 protease family protein [Pirellulaceae bacterium]